MEPVFHCCRKSTNIIVQLNFLKREKFACNQMLLKHHKSLDDIGFNWETSNPVVDDSESDIGEEQPEEKAEPTLQEPLFGAKSLNKQQTEYI